MRMKIIIVISMLIAAVWLSGCIETESHSAPEVKYVYVHDTPTSQPPQIVYVKETPKPTPKPISTPKSISTSNTGPLHAIQGEIDDPVYMNYNDDVEGDINDVCYEFLQYMPTYMEGETDCDDMAVYLWNKLQEKGVKTLLVVGSDDGKNTPFNECDHAWLQCRTPTGGITIEPTIPAVIFSNGYRTFSTPAEIDAFVANYLRENLSCSPREVVDAMNDEEKMKEVHETLKSTFIEDPTMSDKYRYGFVYTKPSDMRADIGDRW